MKKLLAERPELTEKQNKQLKRALLTVVLEAILCIVYVVLLSTFMNDLNFRVFIVVSFVFYAVIAIALIFTVRFISKLTKRTADNKESNLPEKEETTDD